MLWITVERGSACGNIDTRSLRVASETLPSRVVAVSHAALRTLSPRARRKARVVHNGIRALPPPRAAIPWLEAMRAEGTRVVGCYASVVPGKGHAWLIRAVWIVYAAIVVPARTPATR